MLLGFDISKYAIKNSHPDIKSELLIHDIRKKFPFKKKEFDLTISLGTIHNLKLFEIGKETIKEISRVSKSSYIMVESLRNLTELFNLQCWALTYESFLSKEEWIWIFNHFNFKVFYGPYILIHYN